MAKIPSGMFKLGESGPSYSSSLSQRAKQSRSIIISAACIALAVLVALSVQFFSRIKQTVTSAPVTSHAGTPDNTTAQASAAQATNSIAAASATETSHPTVHGAKPVTPHHASVGAVPVVTAARHHAVIPYAAAPVRPAHTRATSNSSTDAAPAHEATIGAPQKSPTPEATEQTAMAAATPVVPVASGVEATQHTASSSSSFGANLRSAVAEKPLRHTPAVAGFSNRGIGGEFPVSNDQEASTSFGQTLPPTNVEEAAPKAVYAKMDPVTITYVPRPVYTEAARAKAIEGSVVLRVRFTSDGHVQVLEVVQSLDPGLDQEARAVAEKIQFLPATRSGQPIDQVTTVHIRFQLA